MRCPFCHDDVPQDGLAAKCGACSTVHHATCFDEQKGCSVAGCPGKVAHLVKGWRSALGDCRACHAKVYLDENVALCRACEAAHHPPCFEARAGCAECGTGEGVILSAQAFARSTARWGAIAAFLNGTALFALVAFGCVAAVSKMTSIPRELAIPLAVGSVAIALIAFVLARTLRAVGLHRAMKAAQAVRPVAIVPTSKPPAP